MSDHDPLCPQDAPCQDRDGNSVRHWSDKVYATETPDCNNCRSVCCCSVIARVREGERTYTKQTSAAIMAYDEGRRDGYAAALRDAVRAVQSIKGPLYSVRNSGDAQRGWDAHKRHVVAEIEALGGER